MTRTSGANWSLSNGFELNHGGGNSFTSTAIHWSLITWKDFAGGLTAVIHSTIDPALTRILGNKKALVVLSAKALIF